MIDLRERMEEGNRRYGSSELRNSYPCPACAKVFEGKSSFVSHMKGAHGEPGEVALARAAGIEDPDFGKR